MNMLRTHTTRVPHSHPQPLMLIPSVNRAVTAKARKVEARPVRGTSDPACRSSVRNVSHVNRADKIANTTKLTAKPVTPFTVNMSPKNSEAKMRPMALPPRPRSQPINHLRIAEL